MRKVDRGLSLGKDVGEEQRCIFLVERVRRTLKDFLWAWRF